MPFGYYGLDVTYLILLPAILLALYAQGKVKRETQRYMKIAARRGYTGEQISRMLLNRNGLADVPIEVTKGVLTDHYDPRNRVLRLSEKVYFGTSITAFGIAAHEVGHAIQHMEAYVPLGMRNAIFPVAKFGSSAAWIFIIGGFLLPQFRILIDIGILLFSAAVLFQIITLPVEFDASKRGLMLLESNGLLEQDELQGAKKVLQAAALTYVAATASAVLQLVRLLILRDRRR